MFNRNEYSASADLQIPDSDIEAGIKISAAQPNIKGEATHSIQMDFTNKNIQQASLVGLAKYVHVSTVIIKHKQFTLFNVISSL